MNGLLATCHHEAGHGVVCELLGGECREISIVPREGMMGWARLILPDCPAKSACISLAGGIASSRYRGRPLETVFLSEDRSDWFDVIEPLYAAGWELAGIQKLIRGARGLAVSYVDDNWAAIESLAYQLLNKSELDGSVVREAIRMQHQRPALNSFSPANNVGDAGKLSRRSPAGGLHAILTAASSDKVLQLIAASEALTACRLPMEYGAYWTRLGSAARSEADRRGLSVKELSALEQRQAMEIARMALANPTFLDVHGNERVYMASFGNLPNHEQFV